MKRILSLALACILVLLCAGCATSGSGSPSTEPTTEPTTELTTETTTEPTTEPVETEPSGPVEMDSEELAQYSATRVVRVDVDDGHGTGFFIDDQGTLVTNYHVIEGTEHIRVHFDDGAERDVIAIAGFSPYYDLAVLKVDITGNDYFSIATDESQYKQGKTVYTQGFPKDLEKSNFTEGKITMSSRKRGLMDCVTFDASISAGSSGSPVLNAYGEVIAVCTSTLVDAQNINFGIKLSEMEHLSLEKEYSMNRYREWYYRETGRSYLSTGDGSDFYYTYVNNYQTVTGKQCIASTDDWEDFEEGYSIMYIFYVYDYEMDSYDKYCEYLNEIGFEFNETIREMGMDGVSYIDTFNGYEMVLLVDTVNNWLVVSCPIE